MLALFAFVVGVSAVARYRGGPVNTSKVCGVLDSVPSGDYTLINDMWGLAAISPPPNGSQCSVSFAENKQYFQSFINIFRILTDGIIRPSLSLWTFHGSALWFWATRLSVLKSYKAANQGGTKGFSCVQQNKNAGYRLSNIASMPVFDLLLLDFSFWNNFFRPSGHIAWPLNLTPTWLLMSLTTFSRPLRTS